MRNIVLTMLTVLLTSILVVGCGQATPPLPTEPTKTEAANPTPPPAPEPAKVAPPAAPVTEAPKTETPTAPPAAVPQTVTTASGLQYIDLVVGTGTEALAGKTVTVHYTGWLTDGRKFDSSVDRKKPFSFPLGAGNVIKGWDEGVAGMKVGGKRKLTIPPELGYGPNPMGPIPPNSTLVFDVELLGVQ